MMFVQRCDEGAFLCSQARGGLVLIVSSDSLGLLPSPSYEQALTVGIRLNHTECNHG